MRSKGFTLIELLVVIAIIATLAVLSVPNFMGAREKSRDTRRKNDLKQIQNALELYKDDQSSPQYPDPSLGGFPPAAGSPFVSGGVTYMRSFPGDPSNGYQYIYSRTSALTYTYTACLENKADALGVVCPSLPFTCTSGLCYKITEP